MKTFIKGRIYNCNFHNSIFRFHSHREEGGIYYNEGITDCRSLSKNENKMEYISNLSYLDRATECTIEEANALLEKWGEKFRFEYEKEEVVYEIY